MPIREPRAIEKEIRDLSNRGLDILEDPKVDRKAALAQSATIEARIKKLQEELLSAEFVRAQTKRLGGLASTAGLWPEVGATPFVGNAPSIRIGDDELKELFDAAQRKQPLKIELKGVNSNIGDSMPATLVPGIVSRPTEPTRIADHLPVQAMPGPSIEYLRHVATSGVATTVAPGALKPEVAFITDQLILKASKIAATTGVYDESLDDFQGFAAYITQELGRVYTDAENLQLLVGDGTGTNMTGLLNSSGIIVRPKGVDSALDALELAGQDLRIGPSFCAANLYIMHPVDFGAIRRAKDNQLRYLVSVDPTTAETSALWGLPVIQTTQIPQGTALALNTGLAAQVWTRRGVTIDSSNSATDDFQRNITRFRIESRLGLAVIRPSAVVKVVGL